MSAADERVPVLIVGGGYVGLAASVFLAQQGVAALLVDRHPGVSIHGKARGINQRTMEIYRSPTMPASRAAPASARSGSGCSATTHHVACRR